MAKKEKKAAHYDSDAMLNELLKAAQTSGTTEELLNQVQKPSETSTSSEKVASLAPVEKSSGNSEEKSPDEVTPGPVEGPEVKRVGDSIEAENKPVLEKKTQEVSPGSKKRTKGKSGNKEKRRHESSEFETAVFKSIEKSDNLKYCYIHPKTHAYLDLLLRYSRLKKLKTTMQEITANIIEEYLLLHREEFKAIRNEVNAATKQFEL